MVEAAADINGDNTPDLLVNINITLLPGDPPSSAGSYTLRLRANPGTIPADMATPSIIVATLTDSWADSVEGITIQFSAELGYLVNDPEGTATSTETTGVTKENGTASVYYYARVPGSAVITAMANLPDLVGPLTDTVRVTVTGDPGVLGDVNIELSVQYPSNQTNITTDQTATIVARITDQDGKVLSGVSVFFSTTLGTVTPAIVAADVSGIARTILSSAIPGTATVYAMVETVAGSSTEQVDVEIIEAPDAITVSVPSRRTITLGASGTAETTLNASAVVTNEDGEFLRDIVVSFSLATTCSDVAFSPLSTSAITDEGGLAVYEIVATATAPEICTYTVRGAVIGGIEDSETGTITVVP